MSNLERTCQRIVDKLVKKSFPGLKGKKIVIKTRVIKKGAMFAKGAITRKLRLIIDSAKYKGAGDNELTGILAHELVHFEYYLKTNLGYRLINYFKYKLSKKFVRDFEINTDKEAIKKGYARELYANRKFRLRKLTNKDKKIKTNYLWPDEIKSYAIKIGKWH